MVAYSNKTFKIKSPLSVFILKYRVDPRKIIQQSKKRFWQLSYAFKNSKKMFLTKNFFFVLIAKVQKKFFKKMFKILFQNKYLQGDRLSCQFFILKLNLSKEIQTIFLIFSYVSFYGENELSKVQIFKNYKSLLCYAFGSKFGPTARKTQISKPKQIPSSLPSNQSKQTFAQKIASNSQSQQYVDKAHTMKVQVLEPFQISNSGKPDLSKIFYKGNFFLQNNLEKTHRFYEFILVDIESIEISRIQNESYTEICYSK